MSVGSAMNRLRFSACRESDRPAPHLEYGEKAASHHEMNLIEVRCKGKAAASGISGLRRNHLPRNNLCDGPVDPGGLLCRAGQARRMVGEDSIDEVFDDRKVGVGVRRQKLRSACGAQLQSHM